MVGESGSTITEVAQNEKTVPLKDFQALQRKLSTAQERAKQLAAENARLSTNGLGEEFVPAFTGLVDLLSGELSPEGKAKAQLLKEQIVSTRTSGTTKAKARAELAQLTEGMDDTTDIDRLVAQGNVDGALALAQSKKTTQGNLNEPDLDALIEKRLAEREQARVNTGQSTSVTREEKDDDVIAKDTYRMGRKELAEHRERLLEIARKQMGR